MLELSFSQRFALRLVGAVGAVSFAASGSACNAPKTEGNGHSAASSGAGGLKSSSQVSVSSSTGIGSLAPCSGSYDCACWQCACEGIATPASARQCLGGRCPNGEQACDPACGALDAGLADASPVTCADVAAGGAGGGSSGLGPVIKACFPTPEAGACPTNWGAALDDFLALGCPTGFEPTQIVSGPDADTTYGCCYMVRDILCGAGGRPYRAEGHRVVAPVGDGRGWSAELGLSEVDALEDHVRRDLAAAWTADALAEHASIASFARFALALMAVGAPAELVSSAHAAALDEVRHAKLCFAIASAYAGHELAPGAFPTGPRVEVETTLAALVESTIEEGCLGETIAALVAAERARDAVDVGVRAALEEVAQDEVRHAELAWRTVAWALRSSGDELRVSVARSLRSAMDELASRTATRAAVLEVIAPAAAALLGSRSGSSRGAGGSELRA